MQEIKLWLLEKEKDDDGRLSVSEVEGMNQTETEQQLEEIIVGNPGLIM